MIQRALIKAEAFAPGFNPRRSTLAFVTAAMIFPPLANVNSTSAFTAPVVTFVTVPENVLRALVCTFVPRFLPERTRIFGDIGKPGARRSDEFPAFTIISLSG